MANNIPDASNSNWHISVERIQAIAEGACANTEETDHIANCPECSFSMAATREASTETVEGANC